MTSSYTTAAMNNVSVTPLNHSTYRDPNAGGQWNCGNIRGYGAAPSYQWEQFCASCPPCTNDRFAVRLAYRDSWSPGCCTAEAYEPRVWTWPFQPATVNVHNNMINLEDRVMYRELYNHPFPYVWPSINDN